MDWDWIESTSVTLARIGRDWAVAVRDHHVVMDAKGVPTLVTYRLTSAQAGSSEIKAPSGDTMSQRVTKFVTLSGPSAQVVRSVRSIYAVYDNTQARDAR